MKNLMSLICLLGTLSATSHAQVVVITPPVNNPSNPSLKDTYYGRVKNLFEKGTVPDASELVGYNIGRCFKDETPNKGVNVILYGSAENTGMGPIDADKISAIIFGPGEKLGYFDNMTAGEILKKFKYDGTDLGRLLPVRTSDSNLYVDVNFSPVQIWEVRKSSSYLVFHLGSYAYCYTFIKH